MCIFYRLQRGETVKRLTAVTRRWAATAGIPVRVVVAWTRVMATGMEKSRETQNMWGVRTHSITDRRSGCGKRGNQNNQVQLLEVWLNHYLQN